MEDGRWAEPPSSVVDRTPPPARGEAERSVEPLSEREMEVLRLIAEGLTNREIAQRLYISVSTVKRHTANIYGKLDVHNRTQAVAQARYLGVLGNSLLRRA